MAENKKEPAKKAGKAPAIEPSKPGDNRELTDAELDKVAGGVGVVKRVPR